MAQARVTKHGTESAPKKRRNRQRRGRSLMVMLLAGFLVVAFAVIWRRSYGITQARKLAEMEKNVVQLEAERARLAGLIRDESGRAQLAPAVEKLGMRVPDDRQVRIIHR